MNTRLVRVIRDYSLLILLLLIVYAPFLGFRLIRPTGDEKVYIAQALEMQANGSWFVQTLAGIPDYYKGPLHYILIRFGLVLFGNSLWAALYMNLVLSIFGAIAVAKTVRDAFADKKDWALWAGAFFALNLGMAGHLFASQMEVELASFYAIGFYFLWRGKGASEKNWKYDLAFWLTAGLSGWIKSPLHSVLLGASGLVFWIWNGEILNRIKARSTYFTAGAGIALCAVGYAPAFFLDRVNFIEKYFLKETLKVPNGGPWWQATASIFGYYLIPWFGLAFSAYFENLATLFKRSKKFSSTPKQKRFLQLALSGVLPTALFFTLHPYRGENYAMPATAAVVFLIFYFLKRTYGIFPVFRKIVGFFTLPLAIALAGVFTAFEFRWGPLEWWPKFFLPSVWALVGVTIFSHFWALRRREEAMGLATVLSKSAVILILNLALLVLGNLEMYQLRAKIHDDRQKGETYKITYWNLNKLIWNEWGLLSLALGEPITPLLSEEQLFTAIQNGDLILARDTDRGKDLEDLARKRFPTLRPVVYRWDRWKVHASDGEGHSLIPLAWEKRDLSLLFDHALMMRFFPNP